MNFLKLFIITIIFLNSSLSFVFANDIPTETTTQDVVLPEKPVLKLAGSTIYSIDANKEQTITVPLANPSSYTAYDVVVQAKGGENTPFTIGFENSSNIIETVRRGGSHNIYLKVKVDADAQAGKYPITLDYSFTSKDKQNLSGSDTFYVKVDNPSNFAVVGLNNLKVSKETITAGEQIQVTGSVENPTSAEAKNVTVELIGLEESNMAINGGKSSLYFASVKPKTSVPVTFTLNATNLTKEGSNKLTVKVTYTDKEGKEVAKDYYTYVNVSKNTNSNNDNVDIKISDIIAPKGTFNVGQSGTFKLKIKNTSKVSAKNLKVSTKVPENIVPTSNNIVFLDELLPNKEIELSFSFAPTSQAITQTYSIGFSVEYNKGKKTEGEQTVDNVISVERYAGFNVNNPTPQKEGEQAKISVPKIIVSKYQSEPTIVEAGKSFKLAMTFQNTHSVKTVKNIKIFLTVEDKTEEKGNVFAPDNSSTTYFIDSIAPKQQVSHTFDLFAVPDAKPRSYTINVNLEYEDEQANEFKSVELVGVNVKQQAKIDMSEITKPTEVFKDSENIINFQLYNVGKVMLSNLMIKFEGENMEIKNSTNFIGNFDVGATEDYEGIFIPKQTGEQKAKIIISYEDTDGKKVERIEEVNFNVKEPVVEPVVDTNIEEEPKQKPFGFKKILVIVGVLVVIGVVIVIRVKKAKAKKELDFND